MKKLVYLSLFYLAFFSCSKKTLLPLEESDSPPIKPYLGTVEGKFCTLSDEQTNTLKIIVINDLSGSNVTGQNTNGEGTDPDGQKRFGGLLNTLNQEVQNDYRYYTGFGFRCPGCSQGGVTEEFPGLDPSGEFAPFTNDLENFKSAVQQAWNSKPDNGGTPYKTWAQKLYETILMDAKIAKDKAENGEEIIESQYVVAMNSDGVPTDLGNGLDSWKNTIKLYIDQIMDLERDPEYGKFISSITINTAFYFHPQGSQNADAQELLRYIAEDLGNGEFFSGVDIDWSSLINVFTKKINSELLEFYVRNTNVVIDRTLGFPLRDADADGLSDQFELFLGSNILAKDSDGNGLSDGIEQRLNKAGLPCLGLETGHGCAPAKALKVSGCFDEMGKAIDKDLDGLKDCEEAMIGSDYKKWDTNNNRLPDNVAFTYFLTTVLEEDEGDPAPPADGVDSDGDDMDDLKEIIHGLHPRVHNDSIKGIPPYNYIYGPTKQGQYNPLTGVTCFDIKVEDITILSPDDEIEINILEQETTNTGRNFLRRAYIKMKNGYLKFTEDDFGEAQEN